MTHGNLAHRVRGTATQLLASRRLVDHAGKPRPPPWYEIIAQYPPTRAGAGVRPLQRVGKVRGKGTPAKLFQPLEIKYPEDELRTDFFEDHPWELARPRVVLEDGGNDQKKFGWDWGTGIEQPGKALDGESVVQRQIWLMRHAGLSKALAYDTARKEFYAVRHKEDVQRRVAREEALHVGAYFGLGALQVGMQLEDAAWDEAREWAAKEVQLARQLGAAASTTAQVTSAGVESGDLEAVAEEEGAQLEESLEMPVEEARLEEEGAGKERERVMEEVRVR
ncbi:mitochondrial ribosomal protein S25-domain-containing protein [Lineolata rhizophorae]|uniref:Small ribosomal subunit protein mS23 n=1 Tax=Lineolata rhizophorae TaxID=578093 RepID=A0A6A6PC11_9PEZI|nr:mitochondrial ribosomal protein S25-domain-containing protein [Lineolata rhizophorae]